MNKYFTSTAYNNIVIWLLSHICLPISYFLNSLSFSPNTITLLSFFSWTIGCKFLIEENLNFFCFFLIFSIIFDFCDGQVARISKKINTTNLNVDHLSDIIKISLLFLSFGILLNSKDYWILIFITNSLYLFFCVLHAEIGKLNSKLKIKNVRQSKPIFFNYLSKNIFYFFFKALIPLILTFNVHSLLLIFFVAIDLIFLKYILYYFIFVFIYRIQKYLLILNKKKL